MNIGQWLSATNSNEKGISQHERAKRKAVRDRVLERAQTTAATVRVAFYRGSIGKNLLKRLVDATKDEPMKITIEENF